MALTRSEREMVKALKEYLYGDKKEREERERKKKEEEARKQEEERSKNLREELDKSIARWEKIALLSEQAVDEDEVVDEDKDQEAVHIPLEGHKQQMNDGVESESEQQEVVDEPCKEKVLGELVTGVVVEMICLDGGDVDKNDQEGIDIVRDSYAKEKTIGIEDGVFVDKYVSLEIYKREEDVGMMSWYFYVGDMQLANVFVLGFNEDAMKGIHYVVWNQHVVGSSINPIILLMTILPSYNWKTWKKITSNSTGLEFFYPREYDAGASHISILS